MSSLKNAQSKKNIRIAILKNPFSNPAYQYLNVIPSSRPWTKKLSRNISLDESVARYITSSYDNVIVDYISLNTVVKRNNYDIVWAGSEIYSNFGWLHSTQSPTFMKKLIQKLDQIKNLYPDLKYIQTMGDKCKYTPIFAKAKIPVTPTYCIKPNDIHKIRSTAKKLGNVFIKPSTGAEAKNVYSFKNGNINRYLTRIKKKDYNSMIVQPYRNFGTSTNPELKCYFVGKTLSYAVGATIQGRTTNFYKAIPKEAMKIALKTIAVLHKLSDKIIISRVDMYKYNGKFIVNEIETGPAIAKEDLRELKDDWDLDVLIGDRIIQMLQ